jgi:thiol-disulfide isomerase/thioredoxin
MKNKKMIVVISIITAILALVIWNNFIENETAPDINIPESKNISFNTSQINSITPGDIITEINNNHGKPVLLFLYTSWCSICKKQLPIINEAARRFQNTDLQIISIAIDKNISNKALADYLNFYGSIYFKPNYLVYTDGLADLLKTKAIEYNNRIPLTVLIARNGKIITRFTGFKSQNYLNRKIMRSL